MKYLLAVLILGLVLPVPALAQEPTPLPNRDEDVDQVVSRESERDIALASREDLRDVKELLWDMQDQEELAEYLRRASAVFIIPDYASASLIVGASGGEGVLLTPTDGKWGNPGFYDVGSLSVGLQAGISAGSVAMLLMNDKALDAFRRDNIDFGAEAGFAIADWEALARGELNRGDDVIIWAETEGLSAELALAVNNITWDDEENENYYGRPVKPEEVLNGEVHDPNP